MSGTNKILLALLGGTVIGAAIGLIFAPEKGEETRKKVVDTARSLSDKILGKVGELAERADGHSKY